MEHRGSPRIAVVGSGAAAAGVLLGIADLVPTAGVTVFERTTAVPVAPPATGDGTFGHDAIRAVQDELRRTAGWTFPPPKSHFGFVPGRAADMDAPQLWASTNRGGLTTVWGGGMLPFSDRELAGWPIGSEDLAPHYARVAAEVGVCGEPDDVDDYFGTTFVNRPPMAAHRLASAFGRALGASDERPTASGSSTPGARFVVGASRLALETRPAHARSCQSLGECMLGCPRAAVWSAAMTVDVIVERLGCRVVGGEVRSFDDRRRVLVRTADGDETHHGPFDLVFLAAGALATTAIVLRSGAREEAAPLVDTALASFPILALRPARSGDPEHVALSNLTVLAVPEDGTGRTLHVSIYPVFDHLLRYYLPSWSWGLSRWITQVLRAHVLIGRVYLGAQTERTYRIELVDGEPVVTAELAPDARPELRTFLRTLRTGLAGSRFLVPPAGTVQATSSHYGCTFPYGDPRGVGTDGAVANGVHIADAAAFPDMPALSPTFTIIANARRTVAASLRMTGGGTS